ncbi:N-acetylmuramoyl-L-alanine amidase [Algibacter marinivivus]|uniref:N-acetylmuramoyl-L-alanine amidase n=1 Tax=Algibacter marinivivus TaxID=2100723 RepID=A0A2U2X2D3_9FLAO|nr:N-acetylmuramoyl-L-alanine amidase [Algibacter marinivivus]PWH81943.1 N-acetylmuramoyl-L-alanine amidase [Algibacter marinivivus]
MKTNNLLLFVSFIIVLTFFSRHNVHAQSNSDKFVIMIDPGHGGRDSGTPGTGRYKTTEKDIALDVSLALGKMLEDNIAYVDVVYTRDKDVFPTLNGRAKVANNKDVDLFISIHCNAQPGKKGTAYGSETYVLGPTKNKQNLEVAKRENSVIFLEKDYKETYKSFDPNSPESLLGLTLAQEDYLDNSIRLATLIEKEFKVSAKRKSRGVKQNIFYVLAYTYMPSVLVELGFLTHKKEEDFLNSTKGKKIMTKALFNALKDYLEFIGVKKTVFSNVELNNNTEVKSISNNDVVFKVQIAASSKALETKSYNFKGLKTISRVKEGSLYKYFYGSTSDYEVTKQLEEEARSKGYNSSFIVAFKDGKKIALIDALKSTSN